MSQQQHGHASEGGDTEHMYKPCLLTLEELAQQYPESRINPGAIRSSQGLSTASAEEILARVGPNTLTEKKQTPGWVKFLLLFLGGFQLFLQAAGIICFIAYAVDTSHDISNLALGIALFIVVILTNAFQYAQDAKTGAMMAQFKKEGTGTTLVIRNGTQERVEASLLVPGDVAILKEGDKITADFRLIEVQGFKVDQSALTGESVQITKSADKGEDDTFRAMNLALFGTNIATGQCMALVIQTGDRTYNGRMAHLVVDTVKRESLLKRNIRRFVHFMSGAALVLALTMLIASAAQKAKAVDVMLLTIGGVCANLPEGLLPTLTLCLALAAKRMRDVNVLVKNMESVETLGACSAICTDKTGTLTQNVMTVVKVWFDGSIEDTNVFDNPAAYRSKALLEDKAVEHRRNPRYNSELRRTESQSSGIGNLVSSGSRKILGMVSSGSRRNLGDRTESKRLVDPYGVGAPPTEIVVDRSNDPLGPKFVDALPKTQSTSGLDRRTSSRSFRNMADYMPAPANTPTTSTSNYVATSAPRQRQGSVRDLVVFDQFLHCCALCSSSEWDNKPQTDPVTQQEIRFEDLPIARRGVQGDASETAIMRFAEQALVSGYSTTVMQQRATKKKQGAIAFNSRNKWMMVIVESPQDRCNVMYLKGGFDRVWGMCGKILWGDKVVNITEEQRQAYKRDSRILSRQGMRLLAMAFAPLNPTEYPMGTEFWNKEEDLWKQGKLPIPPPPPADAKGATVQPHPDLVFIGLVAIQDPPKDGVLKAVNECHAASIKVVMVTGDHPETAKAIAQQLNILKFKTVADLLEAKGIDEPTWAQCYNPPRDLISEAELKEARGVVVTGENISSFDEEMWKRTLSYENIVFARTSPEQKLQIVKHFQDCFGAVVAATGDGVNDSPALRQANVGICMGISGADVTRETADIVLTDDNFASIVNGIAEGRLMYENLKKSVAYTLIHLLPEIIPFFLNAFVQFPLGLTTIQLLCIDLGTEMLTAISFGHEPAEDQIMLVPPRHPDAPLVSWRLLVYSYLQLGMMEAAAAYITFLWVIDHEGYSLTLLPRSAKDHWSDGADPVSPKYSNDHDLKSLHRAQTSLFLCIVLCQIASAINTRTLRTYIWVHGFFSNRQIVIGMVFGLALAAFIIYVPGLNHIFKYEPLPALYWAYCLPWVALLLVYDVIRKLIIRKAPNSPFTKFISF
eukprot:TRINITY_DN2203_c0_g1_i1.p1 TRINITY_DN2203_c0_g1~~TRINITY_DN2203_c0_g1_i1.p1  ORF type:complete len:1204 (-),score=215.20 TRINITY_DN2203_c0_g1_i1:63-3647(-)